MPGRSAWTRPTRTRSSRAVTAIAPVFGGINLEDISAPRCFEIEARLRESLDIPVFHDDQHGTAIVVLAALLNALRVVGKRIEDVRVVFTGAGAAGNATARMLLAAGVTDIVCCDRHGALHHGRSDCDEAKLALIEETNPRGFQGTADEALAGADVFIGLSGPGAISVEGVRTMAESPIVFAMANPNPEVAPEEIEDVAAVIGTGRSDYPNQINNVLAFPGVFRGALDVRASAITREMELAAAHALADVVDAEHLAADYVLPSVFDRTVAPAVAAAVSRAAEESGVARRRRTPRPAATRALRRSRGESPRDVECREHADRPFRAVGDDDEVRHLVFAHQLRGVLQGVVRRDRQRRCDGGSARRVVLELACDRRLHQVEVGHDAPEAGASTSSVSSP